MEEILNEDESQQPQIDVDELVKDYLTLRMAREDLKDKYEREDRELRNAQEAIERELHKYIKQTNVKSFNTTSGTVFIQPQTSARVEDRSALLNHVRETEAWELLGISANKAEVAKYLADNDGKLPPGVSFTQRLNVQVRRK